MSLTTESPKLIEIKHVIDSSTIDVDFNIPLSLLDRIARVDQ